MSAQDDRQARLAAQLRANLRRRKQGRDDTVAPAVDDQRDTTSDPTATAAPAAS